MAKVINGKAFNPRARNAEEKQVFTPSVEASANQLWFIQRLLNIQATWGQKSSFIARCFVSLARRSSGPVSFLSRIEEPLSPALLYHNRRSNDEILSAGYSLLFIHDAPTLIALSTGITHSDLEGRSEYLTASERLRGENTRDEDSLTRPAAHCGRRLRDFLKKNPLLRADSAIKGLLWRE